MALLNWHDLRKQSEAYQAILFHHLQLIRLRLERWFSKSFFPKRHRVLATASWSFPIHSQAFVYQELKQMIHAGFQLRLLYSKREFSSLWRRRRRLFAHPEVCKRDYDYFAARRPQKIERLVTLLSQYSGLPETEIRRQHHFLQAFSFVRMVEAYEPDYIHSYFFYEGTLFALFASFLLDIPRGVTCYGDHVLDDYALKVLPFHLVQCTLVIATSKQIKEELLSVATGLNPNHILVKPGANSAAQFPEFVHREPRKGQAYSVVSVLGMEPERGLLYLAEAAKILKDRNEKIEFQLLKGAMSKDSLEELERAIRQLDISDVIHLKGVLSEADTKKLFEEAHLLVVASVQTDPGEIDEVPASMLEGMASGLPVVATDVGPVAEAVEHGRDGIIVSQYDPLALANAISGLIRDPERRVWLGQNAARKIRSDYDVTVYERAFQERLSMLLVSTKARRAIMAETGDKPLVSVILSVFNAEEFIQDAIESVFHQTYSNWELLLVDHGSTDRSAELARDYLLKCPEKIRFVEYDNQENRGIGARRNFGIRNAKGEYLAFLDCDDYWFPDKLEKQVAIMESQPHAAMLLGATQRWRSWTLNPQDQECDSVPDLLVEPDKLYQPPSLLLQFYPLGTGPAPCISDFMLRKEKVVQVGGFEEQFNGTVQFYENSGFLAKMYLKHPVFISSECWARCRIHPDSYVSMPAKSDQSQTARRLFLEWFESHLVKNDIKSGAVWNALKEFLETYRQPETQETAPPRETATNPPDVLERVIWGALRRVHPVSLNWGFERGLPIDRYYIENFLVLHANDIHGRTLEIEDDLYTGRFGAERATIRDVLHVMEGNPRATFVGDLAGVNPLPSNTFDCVVITQTLQLIYDIRAAISTLFRILKPGGVLLATFPGITRVSHTEWSDSWYWSFTTASTRRLFGEAFLPENVTVQARGNVLTTISFLYGFAMEEFKREELDYHDPDYELLITVRAIKPTGHS